jgi:hypothetical protein
MAMEMRAWVGIALWGLTGCNTDPARETSSPEAATTSVTEAVRIATDRSGARSEVVTLPNGVRMRRLSNEAGFNHVLIGRVDSDGKRSIACVDDAPSAEAFLSGAGAKTENSQ